MSPANQVVVTFNPKANFLAKKSHAKAWADISASEVFAEATQAALLCTANNLSNVIPPELKSDITRAAANEFRMQGAREFLGQLMLLTMTEPERKPRLASANLDHNA